MRPTLEQQLSRDARTLLGLPIDVTTERATVRHLSDAVAAGTKCFFSTPNLNFLIASLDDDDFKQSVLDSDWTVADGMPLVWLGRLLGVPLPERVAGSGVFETLRTEGIPGRPLRIYFFGGDDGVAEIAANTMNSQDRHLSCCGWHSPGFGSVEDMSSAELIEEINQTDPDFIVVALGARKGQAWIQHNRDRLSAPVISHLGAVVNFVAGTVARSPKLLQVLGAEWIWRMIQEPRLVRRYWGDGLALLRLALRNVLPLWLYQRQWQKSSSQPIRPEVALHEASDVVRIHLSGDLFGAGLGPVKAAFLAAAKSNLPVMVDLSDVSYVDAAAMGLFQRFKAHLESGCAEGSGCRVGFVGATRDVQAVFGYARVAYLLNDQAS